MKKIPLFSVFLLMAASSSIAFFVGLHWINDGRAQKKNGIDLFVLCESDKLSEMVMVASLLDKGDDAHAKQVLLANIKSDTAKVRSFSSDVNAEGDAEVLRVLQEAEAYISKNNSRSEPVPK